MSHGSKTRRSEAREAGLMQGDRGMDVTMTGYINCQLDRTHNHLSDKSLGRFVHNFLD